MNKTDKDDLNTKPKTLLLVHLGSLIPSKGSVEVLDE